MHIRNNFDWDAIEREHGAGRARVWTEPYPGDNRSLTFGFEGLDALATTRIYRMDSEAVKKKRRPDGRVEVASLVMGCGRTRASVHGSPVRAMRIC